MILLNDVIHVLTGASFAFLRKQLFAFEVTDSTDVSGILIDIDHPWGGDVGSTQDFAEKALGCSNTTGLIQEEIECLAGGINGSIQMSGKDTALLPRPPLRTTRDSFPSSRSSLSNAFLKTRFLNL